MKPLVSILISAYNADKTIAYTLESAIAQTWPRKEIIVVDDGSTDATAEIVRSFAKRGVALLSSPENQGLSAAQNRCFRNSQGDYIQWLDADDLLAANKIERQLGALRAGDSKRILLSSPWAPFYYRTRSSQFVRNSVWQDLSPTEWLLRKLGENLHMQNATWLVSRELTEAAGPWLESLRYDQDGEYFTRVLAASEGTRFVPGTGIFYRVSPRGVRISHVGRSNAKKESLLVSMKLHVHYLRSLEESERVRKACLTYLQTWYPYFVPDRQDLMAELQSLAAQLNGRLEMPRLGGKYEWMKPIIGRKAARWTESSLQGFRDSCKRHFDHAMYKLEARQWRARPGGGALQKSTK
jgi:glycosyltransferase involved in cell wall biosynthesis